MLRKMGRCVTAFVALAMLGTYAQAETPNDTLIVVGPQAPNMLDIQLAGANDYTAMINVNCYDRLVTWGTYKSSTGVESYDSKNLLPGLSEKWEVVDDGKALVFHLRPDATFQSGNPVTAADVKWSFDRVVSVGGWISTQMAAGSMTKPDQFVAVDAHTFRINFDEPNKLALPDLGVPVAGIFDSKLAKENAAASDPWAKDYLAKNCAGSGPYKVTAFEPNEQVEFERFGDWKAGQPATMERVIYRRIEADATRRALLESGDVDVAMDLPKKDVSELAQNPDITVFGTPAVSSIIAVDMNTKLAPFDNVKVREAIAYAIPYDEIIKTAFHGRGIPLTGHKEGEPYAVDYPVPSPYYYDLDKAKKLLSEAGYPNGFKTKLFFDQSLASTREPMALLIQDSLRKIGVDIEIVNVPNASFFEELGKRQMPMLIKNFNAWLNYPEYHFFWNFDGTEYSIQNASSYQNPKLDKLIAAAFKETDTAKYDDDIRSMIKIVMDDVPRIPVTPVMVDVAARKNVEGYVYWFHQMLDFHSIWKAASQ